jgi:hypothetical protein
MRRAADGRGDWSKIRSAIRRWRTPEDIPACAAPAGADRPPSSGRTVHPERGPGACARPPRGLDPGPHLCYAIRASVLWQESHGIAKIIYKLFTEPAERADSSRAFSLPPRAPISLLGAPAPLLEFSRFYVLTYYARTRLLSLSTAASYRPGSFRTLCPFYLSFARAPAPVRALFLACSAHPIPPCQPHGRPPAPPRRESPVISGGTGDDLLPTRRADLVRPWRIQSAL